jgi:hypothetical protein
MYLVRKIRRSGQVQVYDLDPYVPSKPPNHGLTRRYPRAWVFNQGFAAIDDTLPRALIRIEGLEIEHATP